MFFFVNYVLPMRNLKNMAQNSPPPMAEKAAKLGGWQHRRQAAAARAKTPASDVDGDSLVDDFLQTQIIKGRGVNSNASGRFEAERRYQIDDGWPRVAEPPRPRTEVGIDASRSIITANKSPDVAFDRSINPYRGCEHGCVYCFARPSHAYLGLSPGLDFETQLFAKPDAASLLEKAFCKRGYRPQVIALGTNTDCYQPIERERRITRSVLEVFDRFGHPLGLITKSDLVCRDQDILARLAARQLVVVNISVTTLDRELSRRLEPRAPTPAKRLAAIAQLTAAGVPVNLLMAPVIPGLNDHEIENIVSAGAAAGAQSVSHVLLRLPHELKDLFVDWLQAHVPNRASKVLKLIRDTRGGELYQNQWGTRMRGVGAYADLLNKRIEKARRRHDLQARSYDLALDQFAVPVENSPQMRLF
jgi:DNA repair photolyase